MKLFAAFLLVSLAAISSATPKDTYNPVIKDEFELDGGGYHYGLRRLRASGKGCWHVRFQVQSWNTVYIKLAVTDGDDSTEHYIVMVGASENSALCVQRSDGEWLLDIKTPKILTGKLQYFYIRQSYGHWSIGFQGKEEIASFYDDNVYKVKFVSVRSLKWSYWRFYRPGFGDDIIFAKIKDPGHYEWGFPELPYGNFYMEFAVTALRDAAFVLSPYNYYGDDIYEIIFGAANNIYCCLRRKKGKEPIRDVEILDLLSKDEPRYFWVSYNGKGLLKVGRYGEKTAIVEFQDDSPLEIKYYGVTSLECESEWKFYILCPAPPHVCEHDKFHLKCEKGLVSVDYALYGRQNRYYCGYNKDWDYSCGDPDKSLQRIQRKCYGKQECYIDAENDFFDDPCVGTYKYLQIEYHCCFC